MEDDDLPAGWIGSRGDAAHKLGLESLDRYSLDELDGRVVLLEAEIARVKAHRQKSAAHRIAADALFGRKPELNSGRQPDETLGRKPELNSGRQPDETLGRKPELNSGRQPDGTLGRRPA